MKDRILKVIEEKIRPYLNSHNGDIEFLDIRDGIVKIRFLGECSSCISAKYTVKDIVETSLKKEIPEIKEVQLIQYMDEEMISMAKKILSKKI
ncbi:NifU family protein [Clostridium tyrobutyricum]|jgi:Fe-S cluster biogenesis protein NfuA|nr:NifU family protein [Clostridium tyrobutyricum]MBR9647177.1 NifU family protein [Clostridium tyrobutyricum]MBV4415610.1 NifU family protein [Clostridium tyrobutyricum]MBV4423291.1 NifU family protein [Clostridium tyrobutyricum]MBV4424823.1 NifU family protein [Clostridium tyrobutyricum]MBV4427045.1 NifU family protein [Clostridium tyrobutyricum]